MSDKVKFIICLNSAVWPHRQTDAVGRHYEYKLKGSDAIWLGVKVGTDEKR